MREYGAHPSDAFWPRCQLATPEHIPVKARFPVIDAHNHFWDYKDLEPVVAVMDEVGVQLYVNLTGNTNLFFAKGDFGIEPRNFAVFRDQALRPYPGRFLGLTMSLFAKWSDPLLFDGDDFVERTIAQFEADVKMGAAGLKILKQLGLFFRDRDGSLVRIDDERLDPIWRRVGQMGLPVLIHTGDPEAFFDPIDKQNEHLLTLTQFPAWSFKGACFSKAELLAQRNRMIRRHPGTQFILAHVANHPEDLGEVAALLDELPNVVIDFSARIDELGRQPYTAREFMLRYQDRILFATDTPASADVYRCYFRFLETRDEHFAYPNYNGKWDNTRWKICGLGLPDEALKKIYYQNALRIYSGIDPRPYQ